jgi:hypothetical protein
MKPIGTRCVYQKLDVGIREFVFLEKSTAAVDEWMLHLDRIMMQDPPVENLKELLLLDVRQHVPGIIYASQKLHKWRGDYDLDDLNTRAAVLLDKQSRLVLDIADTVVQIVGLEQIKIHFFTQDRQKAIDWLLSER